VSAHEHVFVVHDDFTNPADGIRQIQRRCLCGLSERRRFDGNTVVGVKYRYDLMGGGWCDARYLLDLVLPVVTCGTCHGDDDDCPKCNGTAVVDAASADGAGVGDLAPPPKRKRVRR
jgi:hypothetical protein